MPKRSSSKKKGDLNTVAFSVVQQVTGQGSNDTEPAKNPAAVALGRLGGLKGGRARAAAMTASRRREIAEKAAKARWKKTK